MDHTFIDVCTGYDHACAIRTNGTLHCWLIAPYAEEEDDRIDKPWTGGAIHNDYISLTCTRDATCAIRRNLDVYCWVTMPPVCTLIHYHDTQYRERLMVNHRCVVHGSK